MKIGIIVYLLCGLMLSAETIHIFIAKEAGGCLPYAAEELQQHLRLAGLKKVGVVQTDDPTVLESKVSKGDKVILLGNNKLGTNYQQKVSSQPDSYTIKALSNKVLLISGADDQHFNVNYDKVPSSCGTLYGVYSYLESLGFRWFYPGDKGRVVPRLTDLSFGRLQKSARPYFRYRFSAYGDYTWLRRIGAGGSIDPWATRHTFNQLYRFDDLYFKSHPQYFSINSDGDRTRNIALLNKGVPEAVSKLAKQHFKSCRIKGKRTFLVIPADGWRGDESAVARQYRDPSRGTSGLYSDYVAEALRRVSTHFSDGDPEGELVYCAYQKYLLPPKKMRYFPANASVLMAQQRGELVDDASRARAYGLIKDWQKKKPKSIYFCRYYNKLRGSIPKTVFSIAAKDIQKLKELSEKASGNIGGEMNFLSVDHKDADAWYMMLNVYVTTKLLWDPELDIDGLLGDFCQNYYGPAGNTMLAFWKRLDGVLEDPQQGSLPNRETLLFLEKCLSKAKGLCQSGPYLQRVTLLDRKCQVLRSLKKKLESGSLRPGRGRGEALVAHYSLDSAKVVNRVNKSQGKILGAFKVRPGVKGQAIELSGVESGINIPAVDLKGSDYTLSAWIKASDLTFDSCHTLIGPRYFKQIGLQIIDGALQQIHRFQGKSWDESTRTLQVPYEFVPDFWYHVACTFSQENGMSLYVNGQLKMLRADVTRPSDYPVCFLGAQGSAKGKCLDSFKGCLDEVKIYKRELSLREIQQEYEQYQGGLKKPRR